MAAPIYVGGNPFVKGGIRTKYKVIAPTTSTVAITRSQSNSIFLMNTASGIVFTLPTAVAGLFFEFAVTVSVTTNTYKVIVKNLLTEFMIGTLQGYNGASADAAAAFSGNGTSHVAVTQNSTGSNATGGMQGGLLQFQCVTTGLWMVSGSYVSNTTATTPFAVS
jgi:hypothetical protein